MSRVVLYSCYWSMIWSTGNQAWPGYEPRPSKLLLKRTSGLTITRLAHAHNEWNTLLNKHCCKDSSTLLGTYKNYTQTTYIRSFPLGLNKLYLFHLNPDPNCDFDFAVWLESKKHFDLLFSKHFFVRKLRSIWTNAINFFTVNNFPI